jgi:PIN domain nuclease of toxin-antitoxin system
MSLYALDTHPLIFYANRVHRQLSRRVREVFEQAERKEALLVPAPALWEVSMLEKVGQIKLSKPFGEWARDLFSRPSFECVPLDAEIISESRYYGFNDDIFDAAIVATAKLKDVPLITRDMAITASGLVEIYW